MIKGMIYIVLFLFLKEYSIIAGDITSTREDLEKIPISLSMKTENKKGVAINSKCNTHEESEHNMTHINGDPFLNAKIQGKNDSIQEIAENIKIYPITTLESYTELKIKDRGNSTNEQCFSQDISKSDESITEDFKEWRFSQESLRENKDISKLADELRLDIEEIKKNLENEIFKIKKDINYLNEFGSHKPEFNTPCKQINKIKDYTEVNALQDDPLHDNAASEYISNLDASGKIDEKDLFDTNEELDISSILLQSFEETNANLVDADKKSKLSTPEETSRKLNTSEVKEEFVSEFKEKFKDDQINEMMRTISELKSGLNILMSLLKHYVEYNMPEEENIFESSSNNTDETFESEKCMIKPNGYIFQAFLEPIEEEENYKSDEDTFEESDISHYNKKLKETDFLMASTLSNGSKYITEEDKRSACGNNQNSKADEQLELDNVFDSKISNPILSIMSDTDGNDTELTSLAYDSITNQKEKFSIFPPAIISKNEPRRSLTCRKFEMPEKVDENFKDNLETSQSMFNSLSDKNTHSTPDALSSSIYSYIKHSNEAKKWAEENEKDTANDNKNKITSECNDLLNVNELFGEQIKRSCNKTRKIESKNDCKAKKLQQKKLKSKFETKISNESNHIRLSMNDIVDINIGLNIKDVFIDSKKYFRYR
ncbi:hypothetical protein TCON_2008 [Astathelohania contejeani]|uniref:Uncharacterized protein n=1 Tax=Astathelohania contejeani TaxID=164912 RepID=A0ABQ7HX62_9MICR|nr:hypothetical protein TCON_2008 [Thelohania contejeani]